MIRSVRLGSFKRFRDQSFELDDSVVLAGPNNAGKSTLLQAIATWKIGLDHWLAQREGGSRGVKRTGVALTRRDFTAVPIREMNLLWKDRVVSGGGGPGASRLMEIVVEGRSHGENWECGLEFQYANREMVYVRPLGAKHMDAEEINAFPPKAAKDVRVVHVPALFGIQRDEPKHERGMQDLLIGQGRSGDILRNLLLEVGNRTRAGGGRQCPGVGLGGPDRSHEGPLPNRPHAALLRRWDSRTSPVSTASRQRESPLGRKSAPPPPARPCQRGQRHAPSTSAPWLPLCQARYRHAAGRTRRPPAHHPAAGRVRAPAEDRPRARRPGGYGNTLSHNPRCHRAGARSVIRPETLRARCGPTRSEIEPSRHQGS